MQPTGDFFHWAADPNLVEIGPFHIPFKLTLFGLILGAVFFYLGYRRWIAPEIEKAEKRKKGKQTEAPVSAWLFWGLLLGSFVLGQLIIAILPGSWAGLQVIGPITIRWYGLLFALAFVVGYFLGRRMFLDAGRSVEELENLLTYIIIATVVGARLGHIIFYDPVYYFTHPFEIIAIWHGGLASHGAAIGILIAMWLYERKKPDLSYLWVADRVVVPVAIGGAFIRTGNFFNSEIIGRPTDLPWAVVFERVDMLPRHPSMLYEAVLSVLVFALLWTIYKRYAGQPPEGYIFGVFLITLFTGRFLIEYTKVRQAAFAAGWEFSMGQILSVPLVLAGIWILWKQVDWKKGTG